DTTPTAVTHAPFQPGYTTAVAPLGSSMFGFASYGASAGTLRPEDTGLTLTPTFPFTSGSFVSTATIFPGVAIASDGNAFAVPWTDGQGCGGCSGSEIWANSATATGMRGTEQRISTNTDQTHQKYFPHLEWDQQGYVIAWVDNQAGAVSVYLERL